MNIKEEIIRIVTDMENQIGTDIMGDLFQKESTSSKDKKIGSNQFRDIASMCAKAESYAEIELMIKYSIAKANDGKYWKLKCSNNKIFGDIILDSMKKVPAQFEPKKSTDKYKEDRKFIGYKFYYTDCEERNAPKRESVEAIVENTSFTGKIFFNKLYKEELQLLMFSLSFSKLISLKLGKFKADGFGTCNIFCKKLVIDGKEEDVKKAYDYAIAHEEYVDTIAEGQIDDIADILSRRKCKE